MTRSRTFKSAVRARMSKTGERYTAARRHLLTPHADAGAEVPRNTLPGDKKPGRDVPGDNEPGRGVLGGVSDAKVPERTGHNLAYWYDVLDRFGAVERGHTAAARHLREAHGVDAWYSQGITVSYERARGVRAVNQRADGGFEVSVTKLLHVGIARAHRMIVAARSGQGWTSGLDRELVSALVKALRGASAKGFTPASRDSLRLRYQWDGSTMEVMLSPRATNRTQVVVVNGRLPSREAVEDRRAAWRRALNALAEALPPEERATRRRSRPRDV